MTSLVVATLSVSFSEETTSESKEIKLEIDDRTDGLNNGNTSFKPGDSPAYFMFLDSGVSLTGHESSAGGISSQGSGTKTVDENISFSNSNNGSLSYPPDGSVSLSWRGRCFKIDETTKIMTSTNTLPNLDGRTLTMPNNINVCGLLRAQYSSTGNLYKLQSVPTDYTEVLITAIGTY